MVGGKGVPGGCNAVRKTTEAEMKRLVAAASLDLVRVHQRNMWHQAYIKETECGALNPTSVRGSSTQWLVLETR